MDLYKHDLYIANVPFLFNREIIEYDMKDAGFSLTKEYELLPIKMIHQLEKMKKDYRKIQIGKIQRKDSTYRNQLKEAFVHARQMFFEANDLTNQDVLSIKKDAIFTTRRCKIKKIGKYIHFRPKNVYTSYIQLPKRLEIYYNRDNLSVKGLNDKVLELHKDYMLHFISEFCRRMEESSNENVLIFMRNFITDYKFRKLPVGYYRTFDHNSYFVIQDSDIVFESIDEEDKELLDIHYNYEILTKFIQIPI